MSWCLVVRKFLMACFAFALVTVAWVSPCPAPQPDKGEFITIDTVVWNPLAHTFEIEMSAQFGIATAGNKAGFTIKTLLSIADANGNVVGVLTQEGPVIPQEGRLPSDGGFTALVPQVIAWDRAGGSLGGTAVVTVSCELLNPASQPLSSASATVMIAIP